MITTVFRNDEVNIKGQLTLTDSASFINQVVSWVVDMSLNDYSPVFYKPALVCAFLMEYTDIKDMDINEIYDNIIEYENFMLDTISLDGFNKMQYDSLLESINDEINFYKQKLIHSQNSAMDDMFNSFNELLNTLNDKAESINIKTVNRFLKELNPDELIKAYKKSGVGDKVRDDAIGKLAKENKDLKNEISARNVKA